MSPNVCQPRSSVLAAVFAGSLWYSKTGPSEKHDGAVLAGGELGAVAPTMWAVPISGRPTDARVGEPVVAA